MTKSQNISSIEAATGRKWQEWLEWLSNRQAKTLTHTEIAHLIQAELDGKMESAGWWAQAVTVAYEQYIGRRQPGQHGDGKFELSVSKTVPMNRDKLFARWTASLQKQTVIASHRVDTFRTSVTPVRSYIRFYLDDKSRVSFAIETKNDKSLLVVTHGKLSSKEAADSWRAYWKSLIASGSPTSDKS